MAKPSWVILSATSGSGNGSFNISASAHTGRTQRSGTVTVSGTGVTAKTITVKQSPKAEFVTITNGTSMSASKDASTVTVTGKSNSSKLSFAWVPVDPNATTKEYEYRKDDDGNKIAISGINNINYPAVTIPTKYTANGSEATGGTAINGDPGAAAEFDWSIALSFPANTTTDTVYRTLQVTQNDGTSKSIEIAQTAGSATLSVSPTSITLVQAGTAQTITVTSNTGWTVS